MADGGQSAITEARNLLDSIDTVALSRFALDEAAVLSPPRLRTLDAIHLAAAQRAAQSLRAVVTYDGRMSAAADLLGIPTARPT